MSLLCAVIEDASSTLLCGAPRWRSDLLKYSFGCVMFDIDPQSEAGQQMRALRDEIPDEDLMAKGRITDPHVTVRFGINDSASEAGIASYLTKQSQFTITLGKTIVFPATENSDNAAVLVVQVTSPDLDRINAELAEHGSFKPADSDYHPHATLAYVIPEAADKWAGENSLEGVELEVRTITIRSKDGNATHIELAGPIEKVAARCRICGTPTSIGSKDCAACAPGTGLPESTQGIESTPDETTRPGTLPTPAPIGVKVNDDPISVGNPESGGDLAVKGMFLCGADLEKYNENHDPHSGEFTSGSFSTGLKLTPTGKRAFNGNQILTKNKLSKIETRDISEKVTMQWAKQYLPKGHDARSLNSVRNNTAVDIVADHALIESKAGLVSNTPKARQWNAKIGQPGKAEQKALDKMTPERKRAYNDNKRAEILKRKNAMVSRATRHFGKTVKSYTVTNIINADTRTADIYVFKGFHLGIGWTGELAKKSYVGSYKF